MNKKSDKANLEKSKGLFFATGFAVVLLLALIILEHKEPARESLHNYAFMGEPEFFYTLNIIEDSVKIPEPNFHSYQKTDVLAELKENKFIKKDTAGKTAKNSTKNTNKEQAIYSDKPQFFVEKPASFPGGETAFNQYIKTRLRYPEKAKKHSVQGRVYLSFVVQPDGSISDIQIVNSSNDWLNDEALRLIRTMPAWHAAEIRGQAVASKRTVSIVFLLNP